LLLLSAYYRNRGNSTDSSNCPRQEPIDCQHCSPYRSADGSCNNLLSPRNGIAGGPLRRLTRSAYDDGEPMTTPGLPQCAQLPTCRSFSSILTPKYVSNACQAAGGGVNEGAEAVMQWVLSILAVLRGLMSASAAPESEPFIT